MQGSNMGGVQGQGTAGTDNPFAVAARGAAPCQLREQQKAMRMTTAQANKWMMGKEADRKKKEQEVAAAAERAWAKVAKAEWKKREEQEQAWLLNTGGEELMDEAPGRQNRGKWRQYRGLAGGYCKESGPGGNLPTMQASRRGGLSNQGGNVCFGGGRK
jgi:hypothetical protein